jgi:hypothetical protein
VPALATARAFAEALAEESSCTGQLSRFRARRSISGHHLLRRSIGKNSRNAHIGRVRHPRDDGGPRRPTMGGLTTARSLTASQAVRRVISLVRIDLPITERATARGRRRGVEK